MFRHSTRQKRSRLVIKLGTSTLTYSNGLLNLPHIEKLIQQMVELHQENIDIVIVSSGAIGAGMGTLGLKEKPAALSQKQALAAIGQCTLMHHYQELFQQHGIHAGQILLTRDDISDRRRFLNGRQTIQAMLDMRVIPIINENDVVAVEEIKVGDNDTLSALVASLIDADLLIILSDIDGLYTDNPSTNPKATLIKEVHDITPAIRELAKGAGSKLGTGGMVTKLDAAQIATHAGTTMKIANNQEDNIIVELASNNNYGTTFYPKLKARRLKQRWLSLSANTKGALVIDQGAEKALLDRKSLLHIGIKEVIGRFDKGDLINIQTLDGEIIGSGLSNYASSIIDDYKGKSSDQLIAIYHTIDYLEAIHADNLALKKEKE